MLKLLIKNLLIVSLMLMALTGMVKAGDSLAAYKGAWYGKMQIPNGPELRIGVEIFQKADRSWGGNVASLDQGARYIPVSHVTYESREITIKLAGVPVSIKGTGNEDYTKITAEFIQGGSAFALTLDKVEALPDIERPQTPKNPVSYTVQEVSIANKKDNVWLAGTLTLPEKKGPFPAVLLIPGSGPNQRDSYFSGHRSFKVIADYLSLQGFAVLRMDKRGVFKSTGDFRTADIEDFVADGQAALDYLKTHQDVKKEALHIIGHSEGSLIAAKLAATSGLVSLVSMGGPGMSIYDILVLQDQTEPAAKGAPAHALPYLKAFSEKFYDLVLTTQSEEERLKLLLNLYNSLEGEEKAVINTWVKRTGTLNPQNAAQETFRNFLKGNPLLDWAKVKKPVLIMNGSKDSQVPAKENVEGIYKVLGGAKYGAVKRIFPDLNHMFQTAKTGDTNEYGEIDETISPQVLIALSSWLTHHQ
ncbi:alpha/beta fold hydrolase [Temperatibacter marinus]|uniref:Alpha/beta fold hydrolase n=1 Tax=Temperatibacter marinus TaxID=1456591 RepID=A0AA52EG10_9PROT|nr:alpha/beta fold hydrolase [Temperatibacter marinus]WND04050.1 alpha/beta fold hydrolase [Temperatibacter marinus]